MPAVLLAVGGVLFYAIVGSIILSFIPKAHGAELPKIPPGYQWESCTWAGEKWTACKMVPKAPLDTGAIAVASPVGVCTGQVVPWASTYLCWENGNYTKAWNTQARTWGPYYPMGAPAYAAPLAAPAVIVVQPASRHGYRDDPIRSFKRMMREFERFGRRDRRHYRCRSSWHRHHC